jgi:hypothetical protein
MKTQRASRTVHRCSREPYLNLTTQYLVEEKRYCSSYYQEAMYSLEQLQPMGLVRWCSAMAVELKRVAFGSVRDL